MPFRMLHFTDGLPAEISTLCDECFENDEALSLRVKACFTARNERLRVNEILRGRDRAPAQPARKVNPTEWFDIPEEQYAECYNCGRAQFPEEEEDYDEEVYDPEPIEEIPMQAAPAFIVDNQAATAIQFTNLWTNMPDGNTRA